MRKVLLTTVSLLIISLYLFIRVHGQSGPATLIFKSYATFSTNKLLRPSAVYVNPNNLSYVFVADSGHNQIDYINSGYLSVLAGSGSSGHADGAAASATFNGPTGISGIGYYVRSAGYGSIPTSGFDLFIVDTFNNAIRHICLHSNGSAQPTCSGQGVITTAGGTAGNQNGSGANAEFRFPGSVGNSFTLQGQLIPDFGNNSVRGIDSTGTNVTTVLSSTVPGLQNGPLSSAQFRGITSLTTVSGANGKTLLTDTGNFVIRAIDASNNVTTFSGSGIQGYADGTPGVAQFAQPLSATFNSADNYTYVADALNNCIRRIDSVGNVSTYAGQSRKPGLVNGSIALSEFSSPTSLSIAGGKMYVADTNNNAIRIIDMTTQQVSTLYQ